MFEKLIPNDVTEIQCAVLRAERDRDPGVTIKTRHARIILDALKESAQQAMIQDFQDRLNKAEQKLREAERLSEQAHAQLRKWKQEMASAREESLAGKAVA